MEERGQEMFKSKVCGSVQEEFFPDFPDNDNTVTATVTKSRRVSFGTNFIKEFIVGSAVSTQCVSEYEQAFSSSDSSNPNSSHSAVESDILDHNPSFHPENSNIHSAVPSVSKLPDLEFTEHSKPTKFSRTICFNADSPTVDMEFTEGCITLAKSILDKKNKEMTVIIQAKSKEPMEEEKNGKENVTKFFDGSQLEMSMTRCLKSKENKREEKKFESEKTRIFNTFDDEMSITRCDQMLRINQSKAPDLSDFVMENSKENRMPLDLIMRQLDKDDSVYDLFNPEKSFNDVLNSQTFDLSNESEKLNLNESMDISKDFHEVILGTSQEDVAFYEKNVTNQLPPDQTHTADPVTEITKANPVTEITKANPVTEITKANPVTEITKANPVTEITKANPVTETTEANPITETIEANPITETTEANPMTEITEANSVMETTQVDPITEATEANSVMETTQVDPITEATEANSVMETTQVDPITEATEANPIMEVTETNPVMESTEADPVTETTEDISEPLLVDIKVIESLEEQSKESNCVWTIEDVCYSQSNALGLLSINCTLLKSPTILQFTLRKTKDDCIDSCSVITDSSVYLKEETTFEHPEYSLVLGFGFKKQQKYFNERKQKISTIRQIPYFLDEINSFMRKINSYLRQVYDILVLYPGSSLKGSILSFRLFSYPIFFSSTVSIDLTHLFRLSEFSLSFKHEIGYMNEDQIRNIFQGCLKDKNCLCEFVIRSNKFLFDKERGTGFVSKRSHIRLLPAELKM